MTMITFTAGNVCFINRVVGVAIDQGRVLLHKSEEDDFWALPPAPQHVVHIDP